MAIGPIEMNGIISRTQDYSTMKQNEDNKGLIQQEAFQNSFEKTLDAKSHQVTRGDNAGKGEAKKDAREKGSNEYSGDGGRQRKREKNTGGKVIVKGRQSFDVKI